ANFSRPEGLPEGKQGQTVLLQYPPGWVLTVQDSLRHHCACASRGLSQVLNCTLLTAQECLSDGDQPIAECPCLLESAHGVPTHTPAQTSPYRAVAIAGA